MNDTLKASYQIFNGFPEIYDKTRPLCPNEVINIAKKYLKFPIERVVDLGSGTGLSSEIWIGHTKNIIGVEPDKQMLEFAENKINSQSINYILAFASKLPIEDQSVDLVFCAQSFHWMEPFSTLKEINRVLKPGGLLMILDYDWPPVINWKVEKAFGKIVSQLSKIKKELLIKNTPMLSLNKKNYLKYLKNSGYFTYYRETVLQHSEKFDAHRFIAMTLSQHSNQILLKKNMRVVNEYIKQFEDIVTKQFDDKVLEANIGYHLRIGIKKTT